MMHGDVKYRVRQGQIDRVFVFRLPRDFRNNRSRKTGVKESDYHYLVLLAPNKDSFAAPNEKDYFIFRDRTGSRDQLRWFRTLFTIVETFQSWGISNHIYVDLVSEQTPHDAFETLKQRLSRNQVPFKPIEKFMETLAKEMYYPRNAAQ